MSLTRQSLLHVPASSRLWVGHGGEVLLSDRRAQVVLQRGITPIVVLAIFHSLWSNIVGVDTNSAMTQQELPANEEE